MAVAAGVIACLAPAYGDLAAHSRLEPAWLLPSLAALALLGYAGACLLRSANPLTAPLAAALVALVVCGPLPAAALWGSVELAALIAGRRRVDAFSAALASLAAAVLAAGAWLAFVLGDAPLAGPPTAGALIAIACAAAVMLAINLVVGEFLLDVVGDAGLHETPMRSELLERPGATLATLALAAGAASLCSQAPILAVSILAVVVLSQQALTALVRPRPVSQLEHRAAVAVYAQAIGRELGLDRDRRTLLRQAAAYVRRRPDSRRPSPRADEMPDVDLVEAVLYHREHWDGIGGVPGAVGGEMIPITSRILAVADAWAGLTAAGTPVLRHGQALRQLEGRAGMHFDPRVVRAAVAAALADGVEIGVRAAFAHRPSVRRPRLVKLARRLA